MSSGEDEALRQLRAIHDQLERTRAELRRRLDERTRALPAHHRLYDLAINGFALAWRRTVKRLHRIRNKLPV